MLGMMIGAAIAIALMLLKRDIFRWYGCSVAAYFGFLLITEAISPLKSQIWFLVGTFSGYSVISAFDLIVRPILSKPLAYKDFVITHGYVTNSRSVNTYHSNTSVNVGTFGDINASTDHYSVEHNAMAIKKVDGEMITVQGTFNSGRAKIGEEVVFGGQNGRKEYCFYNVTTKRGDSQSLVKPVELILCALLLCIPFISEIALASFFVGVAIGKQPKSLVSSGAMEMELRHLAFALSYHFIAAVIALYLGKVDSIEAGFSAYFYIISPVTLIHLALWWLDYARFEKFISGKMNEAIKLHHSSAQMSKSEVA